MECDKIIHAELVKEEIICPFCFKQIYKNSFKTGYTCCENMDVINNYGEHVWKSCGIVQRMQIAPERIYFYASMHKIRKNSPYDRKHHVENTIQDIVMQSGKQLKNSDLREILALFKIIYTYGKQEGRKPLISIKFLIKITSRNKKKETISRPQNPRKF